MAEAVVEAKPEALAEDPAAEAAAEHLGEVLNARVGGHVILRWRVVGASAAWVAIEGARVNG